MLGLGLFGGVFWCIFCLFGVSAVLIFWCWFFGRGGFALLVFRFFCLFCLWVFYCFVGVCFILGLFFLAYRILLNVEILLPNWTESVSFQTKTVF